ncbi:MAG: hypothetical protein H6739_13185 [Alphaproteobacteria bacterium]|nr:hypothetical protein [Alphaproteobacteria bacterium]
MLARVLGALRRWLERPGAPRRVVLLALLLTLPALAAPLVADDYIHAIRLDPALHHPGVPHDPDLFVFGSGNAAQRAEMMEVGAFSWWAAEDFKLAFARPISTLTHILDHALWPDSAPAMHAHSLLWFGLLLAAVGGLYRRLHAGWAGPLALALYALDDARGQPLGFVANRNALIAAFFGVLALAAHDRWRREGWRPGAVLAPMAFGFGLLAGESALATTAFLFAYALFLDEGPRRWLSLAPAAAVVVLWQLAYSALGYGAVGSGIYVHPLQDPAAFAAALAERWPILMMGQLALPPADLWLMAPPSVRPLWFGAVVIGLLAIGAVMTPTLRASRTARFWALSTALAAVPISATFVSDRLLTFVGIGGAGLVACFLAEVEAGGAAPWRRGAAALALGLHLVLAPLLLPPRTLTVAGMAWASGVVDAAVPTDPAVTARTLVILNAPADGVVAYTSFERAAKGVPRPRALRLLATGAGPFVVTREDPRTLRVRPAPGYLATELERMLRAPWDPMAVGDTVTLSDLAVTVTEVTADGRPQEARFTFARPLEDPSWILRRWEGDAMVAWTPPAVGETAVVSAGAEPGRDPGE